jgi:putative secretion ATPase (PEP-CTERM system associated)
VYTDFYKLKGLPFQLSPDARFYFASENHKKAMAYLSYGLNQGEGFIVITGAIGAGKTTLIGHLLSELDTHKYYAGTIVTSQLDPADTLRMVASAFDIPVDSDDKAAILTAIEDFFRDCVEEAKRPLLIIDEAQNIPLRSLEELRMLSNFQVGGHVILQTVLSGQEQFRPMLASPELEQLRQRVVASFHLGPLTYADTRAYIEHRMKRVEWTGDPEFTESAFRQIFEETGGVPRRINTLCSRLLLFGFLDELHSIDGEVVATVAEELRAEMTAQDAGSSGPSSMDDRDPTTSFEKLADRVAVLERYVSAHERTIQKGLDIFARYFGNGSPNGEARPHAGAAPDDRPDRPAAHEESREYGQDRPDRHDA